MKPEEIRSLPPEMQLIVLELLRTVDEIKLLREAINKLCEAILA